MIVVFSHAHPSISKGGAEVSAYTFYLGLRRLGHAAAFVAMCPERDLGRVRFDTPDEHVVAYRPESYDHFFHHAEPSVFDAAHAVVASLRPRALVFHHFLFLGINTVRRLHEAFGVPGALVLHEFLAICHHHGQMVTHPQKKLCKRSGPAACGACFPEHPPEEFHLRRHAFVETMRGLQRLVSPSRFLADRFIDWGVAAERIVVIENGLAGHDAAHAPAPKPRPERDRVVFGYFGQINPFKGIDQILDAIDLIRASKDAPPMAVRVHGNVVGVTDAFRTRFERASEAGGLIDYVGAYDNADVLDLMGACDYVLMASKWWENSPVVIQEAYAAHRPVIAPAIGGMAEKVVDRVCGRHFKPNDAADLARVLRECAAPATRAEAHAWRFPEPSSAAQMAAHYLDALALH